MVIKSNTIVLSAVILLFCILLGGICVKSVGNKSQKSQLPTVIVDAGHGGDDGGAVANDGSAEKEINLAISKKLEAMLKLFGYNVIMTRNTDDAICDKGLTTIRQKKVSDIKNRFKIMEDNPQALFVSIHQNKYQNSRESGAQVFYSPNNSSSMTLAGFLQDSISQNLQKDNMRQIKKCGSSVYLLYHAVSTAVMVECGFVSNDEELKKLKDEDYQKQMAFAIAVGINDYISNEDV